MVVTPVVIPKIENFEKGIKEEEAKLNRLLDKYLRLLKPIIVENANNRIKIAMNIAKSSEYTKYSNKQIENLKQVIHGLCSDAFIDIEPDAEQEAFFNKWSATTYKDEIVEEENELKEMFSDLMKDMFGIDIDFDELEKNPEFFAKYEEQMNNEFNKINDKEFSNKTKKKTKKQIENEIRQKNEEELKNKSIRSIYLSLAKVLHPDIEIDPLLKVEKEEIMKRVTVAYEEKDLNTLLRLEMEWVNKETEQLDKITDDKLEVYISVLKKQAAELYQQKQNLYKHPRYQDIVDFGSNIERTALIKLNRLVIKEKEVRNSLLNLINDFENPYHKKMILEYVEAYIQIQQEKQVTNIFDLLNKF